MIFRNLGGKYGDKQNMGISIYYTHILPQYITPQVLPITFCQPWEEMPVVGYMQELALQPLISHKVPDEKN